jgi:hypothetical protein
MAKFIDTISDPRSIPPVVGRPNDHFLQKEIEEKIPKPFIPGESVSELYHGDQVQRKIARKLMGKYQ